jgi:hypothetical protein
MVHEQREQLSKNIAHHQHEAEDYDREKHIHDQFTANKAIDQFHSRIRQSGFMITCQRAISNRAARNFPLFDTSTKGIVDRLSKI